MANASPQGWPECHQMRPEPALSLSRGHPAKPLHIRNRPVPSKPRVHRLTFQGKDAEHALVHAVERFARYKPLERLDAERELALGERSLEPKAPRAQPRQMPFSCVLRPVDDAQVLSTAALDAWLDQTLWTMVDYLLRLHNHPLAAGRSELLPPDRPVLD